jgi:hypothetical protein
MLRESGFCQRARRSAVSVRRREPVSGTSLQLKASEVDAWLHQRDLPELVAATRVTSAFTSQADVCGRANDRRSMFARIVWRPGALASAASSVSHTALNRILAIAAHRQLDAAALSRSLTRAAGERDAVRVGDLSAQYPGCQVDSAGEQAAMCLAEPVVYRACFNRWLFDGVLSSHPQTATLCGVLPMHGTDGSDVGVAKHARVFAAPLARRAHGAELDGLGACIEAHVPAGARSAIAA